MAGHEHNKKVPRIPRDRIHWQALRVFREGRELQGAEKAEGLRAWIMMTDPKVYVPFYDRQNIDTTGLDVPKAHKVWKEPHLR